MKYFKLICFLTALSGVPVPGQAQNSPCTGDEYSTNATFFRAAASAQSGDATVSKKKAKITARTTIASQIKAKAEAAVKSQSKLGSEETALFLDLVQSVTRQEAANLKVICENSWQTEGKYKTAIVVELPKATILAGIIEQIKSDDKLKGIFDENKFKQSF